VVRDVDRVADDVRDAVSKEARQRERRIARIAGFGVWLIRALGWTWRIRVSHDDDVRRITATAPAIYSLWHGHLLPLLYHHRDQGVVILISEHADGEIIARIATSLGYKTVRGSTSRSAARALLGLARAVSDGSTLAITPDGPRGPAKSFAPGVAIVAQRTQAPVIAASASARWAWRLETWDRFLIPLPFAKVRVAYSEAVRVEASHAREAAEDVEALRAAMNLADQRAND
jgi:lysophospholipid acyltransferase (LPLAT)-like uncharacterized protein